MQVTPFVEALLPVRRLRVSTQTPSNSLVVGRLKASDANVDRSAFERRTLVASALYSTHDGPLVFHPSFGMILSYDLGGDLTAPLRRPLPAAQVPPFLFGGHRASFELEDPPRVFSSAIEIFSQKKEGKKIPHSKVACMSRLDEDLQL